MTNDRKFLFDIICLVVEYAADMVIFSFSESANSDSDVAPISFCSYLVETFKLENLHNMTKQSTENPKFQNIFLCLLQDCS